MKRTLIIGASVNPERYSNRAALQLLHHGHEIVQVGKNFGYVLDNPIFTNIPEIKDIHTITMYINSARQKQYYDWILLLKPRRIIFNPGTENVELEKLALKNGIEVMNACTLVLLSINQY